MFIMAQNNVNHIQKAFVALIEDLSVERIELLLAEKNK